MNNCKDCKYWTSYGHSNRGSCEKLLKSFALQAHVSGGDGFARVREIETRGDFGCTEFSHKKFIDE